MAQAGLKKIALEEYFISSEYAQHVVETASISEMEREKVFHVNAGRLLKLS